MFIETGHKGNCRESPGINGMHAIQGIEQRFQNRTYNHGSLGSPCANKYIHYA